MSKWTGSTSMEYFWELDWKNFHRHYYRISELVREESGEKEFDPLDRSNWINLKGITPKMPKGAIKEQMRAPDRGGPRIPSIAANQPAIAPEAQQGRVTLRRKPKGMA